MLCYHLDHGEDDAYQLCVWRLLLPDRPSVSSVFSVSAPTACSRNAHSYVNSMLATLNARQSLSGSHSLEIKEYSSSSEPRSLPLSAIRFKDSTTRFKDSASRLQVSKTEDVHISTNSDTDHVRAVRFSLVRVAYNCS